MSQGRPYEYAYLCYPKGSDKRCGGVSKKSVEL